MITSSSVIMPRSPWLASPGWTKCAGVPVDARVAAILRPTWPDFPMPVTITRPRASRIRSTAATNALSEAIAHRGDQRSDAAGFRFERPDGACHQVALVGAGRLRGTERFRFRHDGSGALLRSTDSTKRRGRRIGWAARINASLTITVLVSLTKGLRPVERLSAQAQAGEQHRFKLLI